MTSLGLSFLAAMLQAGYEHPIQDADSHGNKLGFLDPLTWELYGILLRSATLKSVGQKLGVYGLLYISFHLVAILYFTLNPALKSKRIIACGFLFQILIFPEGLAGIIGLPLTAYYFVTNKIDGEFVTDYNFPFWHLYQGIWLVASVMAGVLIWKAAKGSSASDTLPPASDLTQGA